MADAYTKISKPTFQGLAGRFGKAKFGQAKFAKIDDYIKVNKPSDSSYSKISKAEDSNYTKILKPTI